MQDSDSIPRTIVKELIKKQTISTFPKSRTSNRSNASNSSLFLIPNVSQQADRNVRIFFRQRNWGRKKIAYNKFFRVWPVFCHTYATIKVSRKDQSVPFFLFYLFMGLWVEQNNVLHVYSVSSSHSLPIVLSCPPPPSNFFPLSKYSPSSVCT